MLGEDAELALEIFRGGEAVPDVRVLRDDAEGLLLPSATDEYRDVADGCPRECHQYH